MPAAARVWSPRAVAWKEGSPSGVRRAALSGPTPSRLTPTATRRALSSRQSAGVSSVPLVWMAAWNLRPEARPKSSTFTAVSQRSRGSPPVNWMRRGSPRRAGQSHGLCRPLGGEILTRRPAPGVAVAAGQITAVGEAQHQGVQPALH